MQLETLSHRAVAHQSGDPIRADLCCSNAEPMGLWTEKYRPKSVEDLDCSPHLKRFLQHALREGFPHLLLYGPPGTGKTTFASLLRPTLQLNASDDRGIDTVRNLIKRVANTVARQIIVLDECENLTKDSQTCLRRILEDYPNTTFIFCTNYYSRIIDPLKSRLLKLRFSVGESKVVERVGKMEGVDLDYSGLLARCNGDLRRCLNVLQGVKPLRAYDIDDIVGTIRRARIDSFMSLGPGNYREFVGDFVRSGLSVQQLVHQLSQDLRGVDVQRCEFARVLSDCEAKCANGCSDEIVLTFLCLSYVSIYK